MDGHLRVLELAGEDAPTYVADYNGTAPHKIFAGEQPKVDAHVGKLMALQIQELQIQRHEAELVRLHWEEEPWLHDESVELVEVDPERPVQKLEELGFHHQRLSVE